MRGENHHYVFANFRKQIVEPPALGRIESGCGLIDDDEPGFANQRLGDAESLFHASGKRVDAFLAHVPEICLHKQLFHKSISRGTFRDAFEHRDVMQHHLGRRSGVGSEFLRQITQTTTQLIFVFQDIHAVKSYLARIGSLQSGYGSHQGGFAGPVGTKQPEHSRGNLQRHVVESLH